MTPVHVLAKPPVEVPLPRLDPEVDPQRELRELTEAIRDDSRDARTLLAKLVLHAVHRSHQRADLVRARHRQPRASVAFHHVERALLQQTQIPSEPVEEQHQHRTEYQHADQ